jgi:hypothetical protein
VRVTPALARMHQAGSVQRREQRMDVLQAPRFGEANEKPRPNRLISWAKWLLVGGPLIKIDYTHESTLPLSQRFKIFLRRRLPITLIVAATLPLGVVIAQATRPAEPNAPMVRTDHPDPWPDSVKIYAASPQHGKALTGTGNPFAFSGGVFTRSLVHALKQQESLDKAFESVRNGYGILNRMKATSSAEGPQIFDKNTQASRKAFLIRGDSVNEKGQDMARDNQADIELMRKTLKTHYNMSDADIIVLDQPSLEQLQQTLTNETATMPEEVLIYFSGEGAAVEERAKHIPMSRQKRHEGGLKGAIGISPSTSLFEEDFKQMIRDIFMRTTSDNRQTAPKMAIILDSCGSGAFVQ